MKVNTQIDILPEPEKDALSNLCMTAEKLGGHECSSKEAGMWAMAMLGAYVLGASHVVGLDWKKVLSEIKPNDKSIEDVFKRLREVQ